LSLRHPVKRGIAFGETDRHFRLTDVHGNVVKPILAYTNSRIGAGPPFATNPGA
jgi:hypothetical protein